MKKMISLIVSIIALTVMAPGHADEIASKKDEECLARNIYHEAANEPEEGKVAVGVVTLNRVKDSRFGSSICSVVHQKTIVTRTKEIKKDIVERGWFRDKIHTVTDVVITQVPICQFSWVCSLVKKPKLSDTRWDESKRIAQDLLNGDYNVWVEKYERALFFHAVSVKPTWIKQKEIVNRIGGHIFYAERL